MCKYMRVLHKVDAHCYVSICEHGAVTVAWENTRLGLSAPDFLDSSRALDRARRALHPQACPHYRSDYLELRYKNDQEVQIWLHNGGFQLYANRLAGFFELFARAERAYRTNPGPAEPRPEYGAERQGQLVASERPWRELTGGLGV